MEQSPFHERNQTPKSKRRIKKLARDNGLELNFVDALACRFWNWDDENFCWVPKDQKNDVPETAYAILEEGLDWPRGRVIGSTEVVDVALDFVDAGITPHVNGFLAAVPAQNIWAMSPLITVATLTGISNDRSALCDTCDEITFDGACSYAAIKLGLFARKHGDLGFAAFDSITSAMGTPSKRNDGQWLRDTCDAISSLPPNSKLVDIVRVTAKPLGGNKQSRSRVLMALGIAGVLATDEFDADTDFWPEKKKLASHFYSNEWSFPMNFWAESGRVVGAHVLLDAMET